MNLKRLLSLLMAAALVFGLLAPGVSVYADELGETSTAAPVSEPDGEPDGNTDLDDENTSGEDSLKVEADVSDTDALAESSAMSGLEIAGTIEPKAPAVPVYTYTLHANYPVGDEPKPETLSVKGSLNLAKYRTLYSCEGYTLTGWNTAKDGSGTSYAIDAYATGNMDLYAQWADNSSVEPPRDNMPAKPTKTRLDAAKFYFYDSNSDNPGSIVPSTHKLSQAAGYTIGEVEGNDWVGYTCKITVTLAHGDAMETAADKSADTSWRQGTWTYDFSKTSNPFTFTAHYITGKGWSAFETTYQTSFGIVPSAEVKIWITDQQPAATYTVTYTDGVDGEAFKDQTFTVEEGKPTPAFEGTPTRTGYVFTGWDPEVAETVTGDAIYTAQWEVAQCVVTLDPNGGVVDPVSMNIPYGSRVGELPVPTREGYAFIGWVDADGNAVTADTVITGDVTFTASWKEIPENVTLTVNIDCTCQRHDSKPLVCQSKVTVYGEDGTELGSFTAKGGQSSQSFTIPYGQTVRLVAVPNTEYVKITTLFDGYYIGGAKLSESEDYTTSALLEDTAITAKFVKADEHLIIFHGNGASVTSSGGAAQYDSVDAYLTGSSVSLSAAYGDNHEFVKDATLPSTKNNYSKGYRLVGWNTKANGTGESYGLDEVITMPGTNLDLYAVWEEYEYYHWIFNTSSVEAGTVSWGVGTGVRDENGNWSFPPVESGVASFKAYVQQTGTFNAGVYAPIKAAAKDGYEFVGWYRGGELISTNPTLVLKDLQGLSRKFLFSAGVESAENTITAVFKGKSYNVTLDSNGGAVLDPITVTFGSKYGNYNGNEKLTALPSAGTINGFQNEGWYIVNDDGTLSIDPVDRQTKVTIAADHTLFQQRTIKAPAVKVDVDTPCEDIPPKYQYYYKPDSRRVLTVSFTKEYNDEQLVYTYQWYKDGVLIEGATGPVLNLDGNVSDSGEYSCVVTAVKADGCTIITTNESAETRVSIKVTIRKAANTIEYDPNGGEGGPVNNFSNANYATVQSKQPTRTGYTFTGWNTKADGSGDTYKGGDKYTFEGDTGNGGEKVMLYAQWTANVYKVTFDAKGGKVSPDSKEVTYNEEIGKLPTPTRKDYVFLGWYDADGNEVTAETVYTTAGDSTYTAKWAYEHCTITLKPNGGKVSPSTLTVTYGKEIGKLPTPEREDYVFCGWYDENGKRVSEKTVVTGDMTLIAYWAVKDPIPKTGDSSMPLVFAALMLASMAGLAVVSFKKKRT